jgi:hypothetical protein
LSQPALEVTGSHEVGSSHSQFKVPLPPPELEEPAERRWLDEAELAAALAKIIELATTDATSALAALGRYLRRRGTRLRARPAELMGVIAYRLL